MIVEQITYDEIEGSYDSTIFTADKNTDYAKAYHAKIACAKRLFNEISTDNVVYHDVDSFQNLLAVMDSIKK